MSKYTYLNTRIEQQITGCETWSDFVVDNIHVQKIIKSITVRDRYINMTEKIDAHGTVLGYSAHDGLIELVRNRS